MSPEDLVKELKERDFFYFSGVPDSTFGSLFSVLENDKDLNYVPAPKEDVAIGIASGFSISKKKSCVVMQNSGLGNIINAVTSFNGIYKIPVLVIIGWRGYGGKPNDAPEHWIMGEKTTEIIKDLCLPFTSIKNQDIKNQDFLKKLDDLIEKIYKENLPGIILINKGVIR
ncbi:MAG: hypothetical protein CL764_06560 [Chloroflexi bacterium]|nr:hypothetical protein [Chloroflexota bacterium]|tara:strand:- start:205 stop:714 length:510 start_codon:yes stop_codon:yes gene_type:complete